VSVETGIEPAAATVAGRHIGERKPK